MAQPLVLGCTGTGVGTRASGDRVDMLKFLNRLLYICRNTRFLHTLLNESCIC